MFHFSFLRGGIPFSEIARCIAQILFAEAVEMLCRREIELVDNVQTRNITAKPTPPYCWPCGSVSSQDFGTALANPCMFYATEYQVVDICIIIMNRFAYRIVLCIKVAAYRILITERRFLSVFHFLY